MVTAPLASVHTPDDVSGGIVVPLSPVVVPWVNHTALLVLFGKHCCEEKAWRPFPLREPGEALILTLLGREERTTEFGEVPAVFLLRC